MYESLTKYIDKIEGDTIAEYVKRPGYMPYINYSKMVDAYVDDVYKFIKDNDEVNKSNFRDIIKANGIDLSTKSVYEADTSTMDGACIVAILFSAIRAERFHDGVLEHLFIQGYIKKWLERLKAIDEEETVK